MFRSGQNPMESIINKLNKIIAYNLLERDKPQHFISCTKTLVWIFQEDRSKEAEKKCEDREKIYYLLMKIQDGKDLFFSYFLCLWYKSETWIWFDSFVCLYIWKRERRCLILETSGTKQKNKTSNDIITERHKGYPSREIMRLGHYLPVQRLVLLREDLPQKQFPSQGPSQFHRQYPSSSIFDPRKQNKIAELLATSLQKKTRK